MSFRGGFHGSMSQEVERYSLKHLDRNMLKMIAEHLKPQRARLWFGAFWMVVVSAVNVLAPYLIKVAVDSYITPGNLDGLTWILAAYAALYGVFWLASYWGSYLSALAGQSVVTGIRRDLYEHLLTLSVDFYKREKSGDIISRLVNDTDTLSELVSKGFLGALSDSFTIIATVAFMFTLNSRLTLVSLTVIPVIFVGTAVLGRLMRKTSREVRQRLGDFVSGVEQNVSGMRVVQSMAGQEESVAKLDRLSQSTYAANIKAVVASALFFPFMSASGVVSSALVLWYGGRMLAQGAVTPGILIAFVSYVSKFFLPLRDLSQLYGFYQTAAASAERIYDYLKEQPSLEDPPVPVKPPKPVAGNVQFKQVKFGYTQDPVFRDLNLTIPGGKMTAIVGPSGVGKSTLLKLIARLYDPEEGTVTIDGIDVRSMALRDVRRLIAFVPQEVTLFPGTIAQNIALGKPGAPIEEIIEASRLCSFDRFVKGMKDGYSSRIGNQGLNLSGGQRQLVSLARAVVMDRPILILDEATSSIDASTEQAVRGAMDHLSHNRTAIVVAHRLATVKDADLIVVLKPGGVMGMGTHRELLERLPSYKELCEKQLLG